jgi:hypothetical protein
MVGEAYTQELQVVLKRTLLATLVTPVGTPSSGSASDNTCIQDRPRYPEALHR